MNDKNRKFQYQQLEEQTVLVNKSKFQVSEEVNSNIGNVSLNVYMGRTYEVNISKMKLKMPCTKSLKIQSLYKMGF
jgi:hypothetical protein